jgi:tetratricopeptide (TPR) repeat protein
MVSAAAGADADTEADIALALMDEAVYSDDPKRVVALLPTARAAVARSGRGKDMQRLADVELAAAAIAGTKMDPTICDRVAGPGTATPTTGPACRCRIAAAAFDIDDALRECGQSVRARQAYYGATHPSVATELHNVAAAYGSRGDHELALATGRTALALSRAAFGFDSQQAAVDLLGLAIALDRIDRYSEARAHYEEAVAIMRRVSDVPNISLARALVYYGEMLSEMGEHAAAAMKARDGLRIAEEVVGPEHKRLVSLLNSHGNILTNAGRNAEAAVVLARSETLARTHFGAGHRMALVAGMMRAQALTRSGDAKAAVGPAQRVVDAMDASASVFNVGIAHGILGEALARSGDKVRGRTELLEARRILDGLGESGRSSVKEIDGLIRELVPAERR